MGMRNLDSVSKFIPADYFKPDFELGEGVIRRGAFTFAMDEVAVNSCLAAKNGCSIGTPFEMVNGELIFSRPVAGTTKADIEAACAGLSAASFALVGNMSPLHHGQKSCIPVLVAPRPAHAGKLFSEVVTSTLSRSYDPPWRET